MQSKTKDTIIRHLKGIVAALEKEEQPMIVTFQGKKLNKCTDNEIQACMQDPLSRAFMLQDNWESIDRAIREEGEKRGLRVQLNRAYCTKCKTHTEHKEQREIHGTDLVYWCEVCGTEVDKEMVDKFGN